MRYAVFFGLAASSGLAGCVEPYVPDSVPAAPATGYLVVDGFINGNGRTRVLLSRSIGLTTTTAPPPERGAKLLVVDDAGRSYALTEKSAGYYQSDSLLLPTARQYKLRITTAGAAVQYESDLVPLKVTPPIDKLGWRLSGDNVELQVSARDASSQSRYYRWRFIETWQFNAAYQSALEYYPLMNGPNGGTLIDIRTTPIFTCWRTERPTTVAQTTTTQLSQDALTDYVIRRIPARDERFKVRYSVLVQQYTETAEEFAYNELLRKNTEAVGTVNDPLPVQLTGNVHRLGNAAEPVLGFVSAHTVQQQRLFIDKSELPARGFYDYDSPYNTCNTSDLYFCSQGVCDVLGVYKIFASPAYVPLEYIDTPGSGPGISSATAECADCRTRGTTTKPSFW